jgi:hypothetical protein
MVYAGPGARTTPYARAAHELADQLNRLTVWRDPHRFAAEKDGLARKARILAKSLEGDGL